ncbi:MAG: hypothetical protein KIS67_28140 [Verrucomicrobiae bacterium]|nr:hypothetical protein [Verrucomicrobiae bacterium]
MNDWPVSKYYDQEVRSVSTRLYLPLYPVAEWMVENWWSILHEVENGHNLSDPEYPVRHDLNRATGAFALPPLRFSSLGEAIELRWRRAELPSKRVEFLSYGKAILDLQQVEDELTRFISIVIERLHSFEVKNTPLQQDWAAIQALDEDERAFCKAAALAGMDPFAISKADVRRLEEAAKLLPEHLLEDLLAILRTDEFSKARKELDALDQLTQTNAAPQRRLARLRGSLSHGSGPVPYRVGYARAGEVREALGLNGDLLATTDRFMEAVKLQAQGGVQGHRFQLTELEGYLGYAGKDNACFVLGSETDSPRGRFKLARCLHDFLYGSPGTAQVVTKADSFQQRVNRSFAAELLAPGRVLAKRVRKPFVVPSELEDLAVEFGVSSWLIKHQLENHKIAKVHSGYDDGDGFY